MGDFQDVATTTATSLPGVGTPTGAVVIPTYDHARFLAGALDSVLAQTTPPHEVVVVDDGSHDDPAAVVARYPSVRLVTQTNQGLSAARNAGLHAVTADTVVFLDADDRLHPEAIAAGLACLHRNPGAALVYGAYRLIDDADQPVGPTRYTPIGPDPYRDLLAGNVIGLHATVLYDRAQLDAVGGFDVTLHRCQDYDTYLRLARTAPVASHPTVVADHRRHGTGNPSDHSVDHRQALHHVLALLDRQGRPRPHPPRHRGRPAVGPPHLAAPLRRRHARVGPGDPEGGGWPGPHPDRCRPLPPGLAAGPPVPDLPGRPPPARPLPLTHPASRVQRPPTERYDAR